MPVNRLLGMFREQDSFIPPGPLKADAAAPAFAAFPVAFAPTAWQQQIYQTALARAREALAPTHPRWDDVILWN
jgi:hypothetical protein